MYLNPSSTPVATFSICLACLTLAVPNIAFRFCSHLVLYYFSPDCTEMACIASPLPLQRPATPSHSYICPSRAASACCVCQRITTRRPAISGCLRLRGPWPADEMALGPHARSSGVSLHSSGHAQSAPGLLAMGLGCRWTSVQGRRV